MELTLHFIQEKDLIGKKDGVPMECNFSKKVAKQSKLRERISLGFTILRESLAMCSKVE